MLAAEKRDVQEELETLKKEQEDLLVLLADQDSKIDKYKAKLREAGVQVCWLSYNDREVQGQAQGGGGSGLLAQL